MKVVLIHQHDPTIPHVGGIGTFIDTFIRNAPSDLEVHLVGVTAQPSMYPVGQWHSLSMDGKGYRFFPLLIADPVHVPFLPLSVNILLSLYRYRESINIEGAILEFHRIEPMLAFSGDANHKVLYLHGHNRKDFYNKNTEVRWGKIPWLYFWLEKRLLPKANHIYIVREDAVGDYKKEYPEKAPCISFLPTWVDESAFYSMQEESRRVARSELLGEQDLPVESTLFLFVGRFEGQKNPLHLLRAFKQVVQRNTRARLALVGEGSLKSEMKKFVRENGISAAVRFLPPMPQPAIGRWMNISDALCLSSAFEGMPRVVVEALHCGLPVVSTHAGEVERLIGRSQGGRIVEEAEPEAFADAMLDVVANRPSRQACVGQVGAYTAAKILPPVYQRYRELLEPHG